jgi:hypothetical protein
MVLANALAALPLASAAHVSGMAAAAAGVAIAGLAGAAALRQRSPVTFLLGAWVLAVAEIVALTEILSLLDAVDRRGYAIGEAVCLAAAAAAWALRGRPLPRVPVPDRQAIHDHPLLVGLAALVIASIGFQIFLVLATPPNNPDSMSYHLVRTAQWYHLGAVERFPIYDERANAFPPNAEIQSLWTFVYLARDTIAAWPQLVARLAILLSVYGLARRAGFGRAPSLFATLVCSTLTLVVVQAVTTQNDLVIAALVSSAAYLAVDALVSDARAGLFAGLAFGLAVGTKWTGLAAVPALLLIVLAVTRDPRKLSRIVAWAAVGVVLVGASSYVRNLAATDSALGRSSELQGVNSDASASGAATAVPKIVLAFGDFSIFFHNANEDASYFGPLGWMLVLPLALGFGLAWLLKHTSALRGALAWSIPIFVVELSLAHPYNRFEGRLLIAPVVVCSALAAWAYGRRWLAAGVSVLAGVSLVLALVFNEAKPVGVRSKPAWELSRIDAQTLKNPKYAAIFYEFEQRVPDDASVGMVVDDGVWLYPFYGRKLERRLTYLGYDDPFSRAERDGLRWLVLYEPGRVTGERTGWRFAPLGRTGWLLAERAS